MHETGLSEEAQADYDKWSNPDYIAGFNAACKTNLATDTDLDKAKQRITYQENCIKLLEDTIDNLKQPWYVKLWNSIPRFTLAIRRVK